MTEPKTDTARMANALEEVATSLYQLVALLQHQAGAAAPAVVPAPAQAFVAQTSAAPVQSQRCPYHDRELKNGKYGPFCSGQGGNGPLNARGYCTWTGAA